MAGLLLGYAVLHPGAMVINPECSEKLYPRGRRVACRYGFGVDCAGVEDFPETGRGR